MLKTLYLGKLFGIEIYIHWSFWLIAFFFFINALPYGFSAAFASVGFLFAVFFCVFLHELGHSLSAKLFGVNTRDITLLPFGGLARLEAIPRSPLAELVIALAGPAVNIAIAACLLIGLSFGMIFDKVAESGISILNPLEQLLVANIFLALFNLIPAFPMDGGRVLRALLAFFVDYSRATFFAARVGQIIAVVMMIYGLITLQLSLIMVGAFVFITSTSEMFSERIRSAFEGMGQQGPFGGATFTSSTSTSSQNQTIDAVDVRRVE